MALRIARQVLEEIAEHARESAPNECCGILLAAREDAGTVTAVLRADNAEEQAPTRRYLIDHRTQLTALDLEIEGQAETAGYYHSHPAGGADPSPIDVEQAVPDTVYLICGMARGTPEFTAWRLAGEELVAQPIGVAHGNADET